MPTLFIQVNVNMPLLILMSNCRDTDIKSDNLMLTIEDESMLERFEMAELETPSPRKIVDGSRTIYQSRRFGPPKDSKYGLPLLCDLGEARIHKAQLSRPFVQPHIYRAREVIFEMQWGPPIDIWNVACLVRKPLLPVVLPC